MQLRGVHLLAIGTADVEARIEWLSMTEPPVP